MSRIIAAQIPFQLEHLLGEIQDEPRMVEIGVGSEHCYSEGLGFCKESSLLLSVYVDGSCALELSLPAEEAAHLACLLTKTVKDINL